VPRPFLPGRIPRPADKLPSLCPPEDLRSICRSPQDKLSAPLIPHPPCPHPSPDVTHPSTRICQGLRVSPPASAWPQITSPQHGTLLAFDSPRTVAFATINSALAGAGWTLPSQQGHRMDSFLPAFSHLNVPSSVLPSERSSVHATELPAFLQRVRSTAFRRSSGVHASACLHLTPRLRAPVPP
jgi:hypothetical protein